MPAHTDAAPFTAADITPTGTLTTDALAREWERRADVKEPIGPHRRPGCAGVLVPSGEEVVDGVLWLAATCTHCRTEVTLPDGKRAPRGRDAQVRRPDGRPVIDLARPAPPDWRRAAFKDA